MESTGCALEECSSERMKEGGMMGWVGSREEENVLKPRGDLNVRGPE